MSALNRGREARIDSVSCPAPGYCSAGGSYGSRNYGVTFGQPFVVNEVKGIWRRAIPVPGMVALNTRKNGFVSSVSCTRPGDCSAGGSYLGRHGPRAFVVDEVNGRWHRAITLAITGLGDVEVSALACASPGNCSAGGTNGSGGTTTTNGLDGTFVVNEVNGRWHKPAIVPGKFTFTYGGRVQSVACPTAGNCTVAGWFLDGSDRYQAFVASEVNGHWHNYITVPGTSPNFYGAMVASLSCPKPGNCTVAGNHGYATAFLAREVNGHWHTARSVPGLTGFHETGEQVTALSCTRPGDCSAGGWYDDSNKQTRAFVVTEVNGHWHNAIGVPGMRGLDRRGTGQVNALSCAQPGDCGAGGLYYRAPFAQGFVVNEVNGTWHKAIEVPGIAALSRSGSSQVTALSCARPGHCGAGGYYADKSFGHFAGQVFVVTEG